MSLEERQNSGFDSTGFSMNAYFETIDLHTLEIFMEDYYDVLKRQIHVSVTAGDSKVAYTLSEESLVSYPIEFIVREIAPEIALKLTKILKKRFDNC